MTSAETSNPSSVKNKNQGLWSHDHVQLFQKNRNQTMKRKWANDREFKDANYIASRPI